MMVFVSLIYVGSFLGLLWLFGYHAAAPNEPWYGWYRSGWRALRRAYRGHPRLTSRSTHIKQSILPNGLRAWTAGGHPLPSNWREKWKPQDPKNKPEGTPHLDAILALRAEQEDIEEVSNPHPEG
jgi:hypothetical protein